MNLMINNQKIPIEIADNFFKKLWGLTRKKSYDKALLLKNTNAIHTFGMSMDIDVLYLDKCYGLVDHIVNVKPNKVLVPVKGAKHIIELNSNIIINKNDYINAIIK